MRLTPNDPAPCLAYLGICYYAMDEMDLAISTLKKQRELVPDSDFGRDWLASALFKAGFLEEAEMIAEEILVLEPNYSATQRHRADFKDTALNDELIGNLRKIGLPE